MLLFHSESHTRVSFCVYIQYVEDNKFIIFHAINSNIYSWFHFIATLWCDKKDFFLFVQEISSFLCRFWSLCQFWCQRSSNFQHFCFDNLCFIFRLFTKNDGLHLTCELLWMDYLGYKSMQTHTRAHQQHTRILSHIASGLSWYDATNFMKRNIFIDSINVQ